MVVDWEAGRIDRDSMLYWIRFLNALIVAMIVWLGYVAASMVALPRADLRIGVPLLLAFLPQNIFYAMNNDVLSPVCFSVLFLCVLRWLRTNAPSFLFGVFTGLAIAATCLTKMSNVPAVAVAVVIIIARTAVIIRRAPRAGLIALSAIVLCAAIPIGSWMLWTMSHFGDLTGSTGKIALLGRTRKPFVDWWHHPIFTPRGLWIFWSDLIASFLRGEISWHGLALRWRVADGFYAISTLVFVAAASVHLRKQTGLTAFQRQAIGSAISDFHSGHCLSGPETFIQFDFGNCINPSRAHPYFTSGRLLTGALIPFAIVYVYGVASVGGRFNARLGMVVLGCVVVFMFASEIWGEPRCVRERTQLVSHLRYQLPVKPGRFTLHDAACSR